MSDVTRVQILFPAELAVLRCALEAALRGRQLAEALDAAEYVPLGADVDLAMARVLEANALLDAAVRELEAEPQSD